MATPRIAEGMYESGSDEDFEIGEIDDDPYPFLPVEEPLIFKPLVTREFRVGLRNIYQDLSEYNFTANEKIWFCRYHIRSTKVGVSKACATYCICVDTVKGWLKKYDKKEAFHSSGGNPFRIDEVGTRFLKDSLKKVKNLLPVGSNGRRGNVPHEQVNALINSELDASAERLKRVRGKDVCDRTAFRMKKRMNLLKGRTETTTVANRRSWV